MNGMLVDLRFAARNLLRTPGFSLMVVLTLALGIGATTALFNVVLAVILQPLPYAEPDRLLHIGHLSAERGPVFSAFSPQDFDDLKTDNKSLSAVAAYMFWPDQSTTNVMFTSGREQLDPAVLSQDFFSLLAMNPLLGHTFMANESNPGGDRAVVLSQATWEKLFNSDPAVLGRTLSIDGDPYSVIGVMLGNFAFPAARVQIWLPLSFMTEAKIPHLRGVRWLDVVGRLAPGFSADGARSDIDGVLSRLKNDYRDSNEAWGHSAIVGMRETITGNTRSALLLSFSAAALVLTTACVNVARSRKTDYPKRRAPNTGITLAPSALLKPTT
jgi:putative ABC transport system permease protein